MIMFILKGIVRDKGRSLLPVIVVSLGVMFTVFLSCWLKGIMNDSFALSANFGMGHVKVMTKAYARESDQMPNDLAFLGTDTLLTSLKTGYPDLDWVSRIRFGGLIDFPDSTGETKVQGPVVGWGIDLFSQSSHEKDRFNLESSLKAGKIHSKPGEALITYDFAHKFGINPGNKFTLFSTTVDGSMSFKNFIVAGTVRFGSSALDRGAVIADLGDLQSALGMENSAGEILGFFKNGNYDNNAATLVCQSFNLKFVNSKDEYAPVMLRLRDQGGLADYMDYVDTIGGFMLFVFVMAMSVVLWNAGLLGGLRRYGEFGLRLAMGEEKKHIYWSLIYEGLLIGTVGSVIGTFAGLCISAYLQKVGFDISGMLKNSTFMMHSVVRASITPQAFYIGFVPGVFSVVVGNALSGIGIYHRKTAQLFKEFEN